MRLFPKMLLILVLIVVLLFSAGYVFWRIVGKALLAGQITALTGKKTTIGRVLLYPPFSLEVKDIDIEGVGKAESVFAAPSVLGLLAGKLAFNELVIVKPVTSYVKFTPAVVEDQPVPQTSVQPAAQRSLPRFFIKKLRIKEGKLDLIDKDVSKDGLSTKLSSIDVDLENLYSFPVSVITEFHVRARVGSREGLKDGMLDGIGWINLSKKDMKASLTIDYLDGIYFSPYYSQWLDLEKARIESARVKFTSDIQGANNEVTANCRLEFTEIAFKKRGPEEKKEKEERLALAVIDIFKSMDNNQIVLDFTVKTKINSPTFSFSAIKMAFVNKISAAREGQISVENVVKTPGKVIGGTVEGLADITKAVISGGAGIGKELKSAIEGAFTKVPQPQPEQPVQPLPEQPVQQPEQPVQQPETASQPQ